VELRLQGIETLGFSEQPFPGLCQHIAADLWVAERLGEASETGVER
jgi:hypothetical protein